MVYDGKAKIPKTLDKLEKSELNAQNTRVLEDFTEHLMAQNLSDHKIYRYIQTFRVLSHEINFNLEEATKKDLIKLIGKINQNNIEGKDYKPESRKELKKAFKKLYKWLEESENPKKLDFMSLTIKKSNRETIDPSRLPKKRDIETLLTHANSMRDKAIIAVLWETGARASELIDLDWEDIRQDGDLLRVNLKGKTGHRIVPIFEFKKVLMDWKEAQDVDSRAVFTSFHSGDRISYRCMYKQIRKTAEKAELDRKVNPHAFRKSRATFLASKDANIFQLMKIFGWSTPETAKVYVRLADSDVDDLIMQVAG